MSVLTAGSLKASGLFNDSSIDREMIGHKKHSVLPDPVPVDTNKSLPFIAPSRALT